MKEIVSAMCLGMFCLTFMSMNDNAFGTYTRQMEVDTEGSISQETYSLLNQKLDKFPAEEAERISSQIEVLRCTLKPISKRYAGVGGRFVLKYSNEISCLLVGPRLPDSPILENGYTLLVYKFTEENIDGAVFWLEDEYGMRELSPDSLAVKAIKDTILAALRQK